MFADEAAVLYERATTTVLKNCMLLYFAYADFEEVLLLIWWCGGTVGSALYLVCCRFDSHMGRDWLHSDIRKVLHTLVPVAKQCNLVQIIGQWYSKAGRVIVGLALCCSCVTYHSELFKAKISNLPVFLYTAAWLPLSYLVTTVCKGLACILTRYFTDV